MKPLTKQHKLKTFEINIFSSFISISFPSIITRADNEPIQLENNSELELAINSLNLVYKINKNNNSATKNNLYTNNQTNTTIYYPANFSKQTYYLVTKSLLFKL